MRELMRIAHLKNSSIHIICALPDFFSLPEKEYTKYQSDLIRRDKEFNYLLEHLRLPAKLALMALLSSDRVNIYSGSLIVLGDHLLKQWNQTI